MPLHHKIDEELSPEELEELRKFVREVNGTRTVDECHEWVQARGYTIGRTAVGNWLQKFREELVGDRMKAGGALARALIDAAKESGGVAVADAAVMQLAQVVFEKVSAGDLSTNDVGQLSLAMQRMSLAKKRIEDVRTEYEERQKQAIEAGSKIAKEGGDARSVVDKVREVLGVK